MDRRMIARLATMSAMLGISTVACTPDGGHVSALSAQAPRAQESAARFAGKARSALKDQRGTAAVDAAEKAVALDPRNGGYRMLLGQSYLAAGRFASAETSFRDALTLDADLPKARFDMALTQIAQGRDGDAQATLHMLTGAIPAGDLGLALALAGDRQSAIPMLVEVVRSGKSDARVRQNLALAFALNGQWREARAVAMQDTPADRIDDQMAHFAQLAKPQTAGVTQVAAMLGVRPANDPGLPTELALANPSPTGETVQLALAEPAPAAPAAVVPVASPSQAAPEAPAVAQLSEAPAGSISVPLDAPAPVAVPASAPAAAVVMAAQQQVRAPRMVTPPPPLLLRAPAAPIRQAVLAAPRRPALGAGGYVVQLGAFAHAGAIQVAWSQAARMMPRLASFSPVRAQFSFDGTALVRLSVSGFDNRDDAVKLCQHVRGKGGECFVRAAAGDAPLHWVKRDTGTQVASR